MHIPASGEMKDISDIVLRCCRSCLLRKKLEDDLLVELYTSFRVNRFLLKVYVGYFCRFL